jgi:hypothetical protein
MHTIHSKTRTAIKRGMRVNCSPDGEVKLYRLYKSILQKWTRRGGKQAFHAY